MFEICGKISTNSDSLVPFLYLIKLIIILFYHYLRRYYFILYVGLLIFILYQYISHILILFIIDNIFKQGST